MVNGKVAKRGKVYRSLRQSSRNPNLPPTRRRHETRPYSTEARTMAFRMEEQGLPMVNPQPNRSIFPCRATRSNWRRRRREEGHYHAYKRNGGRRATALAGIDILLLAQYRCIHPEATTYEVIAYLWNTHGRFQNPPRFYCPSQITRTEQLLGLSRKRSSKTARQALSHRIRNWRYNYWHLPLPYGVANVDARDMIDIDEAVVTADDSARHYGKSFMFKRVRYHGPYSRDGGSVRVIMAISGDPTLGYRWTDIQEQRGGTTFDEFYRMIDRISNHLNQQQPGRSFVFIMDNLNIHHNPLIALLLLTRGHFVVFRAPYTPVDGPIDYVFNTLEAGLVERMHRISTAADVAAILAEKIASMTDFSAYFHHVGYR